MRVFTPNVNAEDAQLLLYIIACFQRLPMGSQVAAGKMCVDCEGRVAVEEETISTGQDRAACRHDL